MRKSIDKPPRRTAFIDVLNFGLRASQRVGAIAPARLDRDTLLERAALNAGLDDFGDPWFLRPFQVLLDAIASEARLNLAGRHSAALQFNKVLIDRLWAQNWFKKHPEILERAIPRPVVIVGPMRSGTTRMHRLLASDQRFSYMRSFETISPVPRPDFEQVLSGEKPDFRPILAERVMKVARLANPRTLSIHPTGPFEPEEELGLLVASMWGMKHEAQWQIPGYGRWCEGEDAVPAYRYLADLLRLVGWSQQSSSIRPWILKTPQHMLDLPALLNVFPDARLIFTHRDPQNIVGSAASLAWNQTIIYSDHVDAQVLGKEWLHKSKLQIDRMREARKAIAPGRVIDVHYEEMEKDWRGTMDRVYRFLGMEIEPAVPAMQDFLLRSRALKRHPHRYSLQEFGLSAHEVTDQFSDYIAEFDVLQESASELETLQMRASLR
ncbi:MAG: sulfotransferase [Erythrobacter sp.]|uniref:sulfotransferase family protein n=1 Tax=Marinobacter alexandrii TaxID=2570351 RepID=UPI003297B1C7